MALLDGPADPQRRESSKRVSPDSDAISVDKFPERIGSQYAVQHEPHFVQAVQVLTPVTWSGSSDLLGVPQKTEAVEILLLAGPYADRRIFVMVIRACHDPAASGEGLGEKHCTKATAPVPVRKDQERIGAAFGKECCIDSNVPACWSPVVVQLRLRRGWIPDGHGERLLLPVLSVLEINDLIADIEQGLRSVCVCSHGRVTQDAENKEGADPKCHRKHLRLVRRHVFIGLLSLFLLPVFVYIFHLDVYQQRNPKASAYYKCDDGSFKTAPGFILEDLEKIFQHEVLKMLKKEGKISDAIIP